MVNVDIVHSVYTRLDNRPGSLERATRLLGDHRINIEAVSLETSGNVGFARFLTPKAKEAVEVLRRQNIEAWESQLAVAGIPNRAGELSRVCQEIAAAQINIEGLVTTADGRLAFRTNDIERTAQILRKL